MLEQKKSMSSPPHEEEGESGPACDKHVPVPCSIPCSPALLEAGSREGS